MYLVEYLAGRAPDGAMDLGVFKYVIALAMAGVSILMMSRVVYPSFKHINMRTRGTMYAIVFIVLAVICIFKFPWVMPAVIFSIYLLYGLVRPLGGPPLAEQAGTAMENRKTFRKLFLPLL